MVYAVKNMNIFYKQAQKFKNTKLIYTNAYTSHIKNKQCFDT